MTPLLRLRVCCSGCEASFEYEILVSEIEIVDEALSWPDPQLPEGWTVRGYAYQTAFCPAHKP